MTLCVDDCVLMLWCCDVVVLWCCGVVVLWCRGAVVPWCCDVVVLRCFGLKDYLKSSMLPFSINGTIILWLHVVVFNPELLSHHLSTPSVFT